MACSASCNGRSDIHWSGQWLNISCAGRLFLRKLRDTLRIPVLALVDSDPYGLKILSVYMKGGIQPTRPLPIDHH